MSTRAPFSPSLIFAGPPGESPEPPRVLISPHRYIQGRDVIDHLGRYLSILPSRRPAVLITKGGKLRFGERIERNLIRTGLEPRLETFRGECSAEEVERLAGVIRGFERPVDSVIAVGGGKCIDAGKCVAFRLSVPVVIVPTLASTDAPCSAVSVMYTEEGVGKGPEFFPNSPALVVVDTAIIASAPIRHFVAGMGDALATGYEARTCFQNPRGRSMVGGRITIAALTLAELCAKTVFEHGSRAVEAIRHGEIDFSVECIVEANTLLSGVGFESGGLAAAHAMALGLTVIPALHRDYLHGELVSTGLVAHLMLEENPGEARRVARFFMEVGLPVCMRQFGLDFKKDSEALIQAMTWAMIEPFVHYEPVEVTPQKLLSALQKADQLGAEIIADVGDAAFRRLHSQ